jgi:hypothetical protein
MHASTRGRVLLYAAAALALAASISLAQPPQLAAAGGDARVIITEIMYNPNSKEDKGQAEWVEIANVGGETIDIVDWRLDDEDNLDWGKFSCTLAPGGIAVLINAAFVKEDEFRAAWDVPGADSAASPARPYQVIAVTWGGMANAPSKDNEVLQLRNNNDEVVCEVRQQGEWPECKSPDGSSIFLLDVTATTLSDPNLWKRAVAAEAGARGNTKTQTFGGNDIGSPGFVPGLSTEVAARPAPPKPHPDNAAASQPATKPANTIDY